ncbi:MAG: SDR family NAD(P)-dependent oxidoreductase [Tolypothrix brevis GSE-NOS-MK-07-07A]|jgi:malonyl CoA-acyl carrier protein transacylase|nr:SDR family NAD(P)-dependent oxidoreductase [Tolypothrix brevis GSE-NOS-MK-07-07A]
MSKISERFAHMSPLKQALIAMEEMRYKLDKMERQQTEPIAIIGTGCRFPGGANTPQMFWQRLQNGFDAIQEVPLERWYIDAYSDSNSETEDKIYTRQGGFLDVGVDGFDAEFFGIAPREIVSMDPQQRLLLEVTWEALENAGQAPDKLAGSQTGVFVGINTSDYLHLHKGFQDPSHLNAYFFTGNTFSIAAGRLSYILGLQGPSIALDTSCSSSLVSIHLACESLRTGGCNLALAGGVHLMLSSGAFIVLSKMRALATDGRCKTFDAAADGYGRGEGCGIVVLKRLSDAIANGDNILAMIRGSAINHDGRSGGLTVPNGLAQQAVIRAALTNAKLEPKQVNYVEVHGTGTALGDPIEIEALASVLSEGHSKQQPLMVGSVKTNIGHLEAAAGVAGVIKVMLAMQHEEIPPHLHLKNPNSSVSWEDLPIMIPTQRTSWLGQARSPRVAGVSSFGMSGTNAHVILEEAPVRASIHSEVERPLHILTLSAKSETALQKLADRFENYLENNPLSSIGDVCFTTNTGRSHFSQRLAIVAKEPAQIQERLAAFAKGETPDGLQVGQIPPASRTKVAFLFTGQGSQYIGMGRELYKTQPTFRKALERCDELLLPYFKQSLLSLLYVQPEIDAFINETAFTQPALFAIEYALAQLWQSWGVEPAIVMGHSVGEYVAACIAGVFSLEDGLKLIAQRGRLMQALPQEGKMVAIFAEEARVIAAIEPFKGQMSIAAINGPKNIVISGKSEAVQAVTQTLEAEGIRSCPLKVSHAFHSPMMEPILDAFKQIATEVKYSSPQIKMISNLTGELVKEEEVTQAEYWCRHLREAVKFSANMQTLHKQSCELFVEIGPHPVLLGMGRQCLPGETGVWLPSLHKGKSDWQQLLHSLGEVYVRGVEVDWCKFDQDYPHQRLELPTYPFQHSRYWLEPASPTQSATPESPIFTNWLHEVKWQPKSRTTTIKPGAEILPERQGRWLVFADQNSQISAKLAALLEARGETCIMVSSGKTYEASKTGCCKIDSTKPEDFQRLLREVLETDAPPCHGIIYCWSLDITSVEQTTASSLDIDQARTCGSALYLVQALSSVKVSQLPRLWLVTQGAQLVGYQANSLAVAQAPLWGLGRVIATEHPELWGGLLDLAPGNPEEAAANCLEELCQPDQETEVAFRQGQRYVPRLVRSESAKAVVETLSLRSDGTYLITGGLGGLGLKMAEWMVNRGARHLVLIGRSGASQYASEQIRMLREVGAEIIVARANISQENEVQAVLADIAQSLPPLLGIMHLAGVLDEGVLLRQDWERFAKVMAPKVAGAWNLHSLTQNMPLEFFVMFSSSASLLGVPGQGSYSAANTFLDVLAHYRHLQKLPALSINWTPWDEVGIAASLNSNIKQRWAAAGISVITLQQGLQTLEKLFSQSNAQVGVLAVNWSNFMKQSPANFKPPLLSKIFDEHYSQLTTLPSDQLQHDLLERLKAAVPKQRRAILATYIQNCVAMVLGRDSLRLPEIKIGFFELGMDSLMTLELKNRLQSSLGYSLPATLTYEYSTIHALTEYFLSDVLSFESHVIYNTESLEDAEKQTILTEIEQLSINELEAIVDEELSKLV